MGKKLTPGGKGAKPLGKSGVNNSEFSAGRATTKKSAKINTGKNKANASISSKSKKGLKILGKDGLQAAGKSKGSSKGPRGKRGKK